jgi:hypothetical protein
MLGLLLTSSASQALILSLGLSCMKQMESLEELFQLQPDHNGEKYEQKTVEFIYDLGGQLLLLTGQIVVNSSPKSECVNIHYTGRLDRHDLPCTDYVFHVSQAHLGSMVPARTPGSRADFLMERPLGSRVCVKTRLDDHTPIVEFIGA